MVSRATHVAVRFLIFLSLVSICDAENLGIERQNKGFRVYFYPPEYSPLEQCVTPPNPANQVTQTASERSKIIEGDAQCAIEAFLNPNSITWWLRRGFNSGKQIREVKPIKPEFKAIEPFLHLVNPPTQPSKFSEVGK